MRAAGLDDVVELGGLGREAGLELLQRRQQVVAGLRQCRQMHGRGEDVVGGLPHVDVVVAVHRSAGVGLRGQGRDDLVGVHVRGGARAGLEDVDRELVVELAGRDAVGGAAMRSAMPSSSRPSSALTRAAAPLMRPSQWITGAGMCSPEIGEVVDGFLCLAAPELLRFGDAHGRPFKHCYVRTLPRSPIQGRLHAFGIADAWFPTEQVAGAAVAEGLVDAHHLDRLTGEQRPCVQTGEAARDAVPLLQRGGQRDHERVRDREASMWRAEPVGEVVHQPAPGHLDAVGDVEGRDGGGTAICAVTDGKWMSSSPVSPSLRGPGASADARSASTIASTRLPT